MDTFVAIVGLVLTVLSMKFRHVKQIRYYIQENKNEAGEYSYLVVFWNSTKEVIDREDLYQLDLIIPKNSKVTTVFSNDQLLLKIGKKKKYKTDDRYERRKLTTDFLTPNSGYILKIDTSQKEHEKIGLLGRIKGENKFSVNYYCNLYRSKCERIFFWIATKVDFIQLLLTVVAVALFGLIAIVYSQPIIRYGSITVIIIYILSAGAIIKTYSRPYRIKKFIKDNFSHYRMIKDETKIFFYPSIDNYKIEVEHKA